MRKIVLAGATTVTGVVLLLSYPTSRNEGLDGLPAAGAATGTVSPGAADRSAAAAPGGTATGGAVTDGGTGTSSAAPAASGTYTGDAVNTRWGVVQVEVTVDGGQVTDARAVRVPDANSRDQLINAYAVPILEQETVSAGSARIDAVTGATVTSNGYIESLQSALDQAGLR